MKHPGLNCSDGDSEDETLFEQFDLRGMTVEEVRAYNMIAPAGQRLQDVFSDNEDPIGGFDGSDNCRLLAVGLHQDGALADRNNYAFTGVC